MRLVLKTRRSEFMTNPTPEVEYTAATIIGRTMFRTCLIGLKRDCEEWSDRVLEYWRIGGWNTGPIQIKLPKIPFLPSRRGKIKIGVPVKNSRGRILSR